jgi:hypothetical protein
MDPIIDEQLESDREKGRVRRILKVVKTFEFVALGLLMAGALFRIQHWPASFLIMAVSIFLFAVLTVLKLIFSKDKLIELVKLVALCLMVGGAVMRFNQVQYGNTVTTVGIVLLLSFLFFGNKTRS